MIEVAHLRDVTKENLNRWFNELEKIIKKKNIQVENIYNIDEMEFAIGAVQRSYIVNKELETIYRAQSS